MSILDDIKCRIRGFSAHENTLIGGEMIFDPVSFWQWLCEKKTVINVIS